MRAVVYERYGSPDVLRVDEVPVPSPADDQMRVNVHIRIDRTYGLGDVRDALT